MSRQKQCQDQVSEEDLEIFLETLKNRGHSSLNILYIQSVLEIQSTLKKNELLSFY